MTTKTCLKEHSAFTHTRREELSRNGVVLFFFLCFWALISRNSFLSGKLCSFNLGEKKRSSREEGQVFGSSIKIKERNASPQIWFKGAWSVLVASLRWQVVILVAVLSASLRDCLPCDDALLRNECRRRLRGGSSTSRAVLGAGCRHESQQTETVAPNRPSRSKTA